MFELILSASRIWDSDPDLGFWSGSGILIQIWDSDPDLGFGSGSEIRILLQDVLLGPPQ